MEQRFYSNGKLLITGEYAVLDGALAWALPTKFGQDLCVKPSKPGIIHWKSFDSDGKIWFETQIEISEIENFKSSGNSIRETLLTILNKAHLRNPEILAINGFEITTHLDFPGNWGLGTSSTLINNVAAWFEIDAYELLFESFGGSGYDIACAQNNRSLFYKLDPKPLVELIDFNPTFKDSLYFVHLNEKRNSKSAIATYRKIDIAKRLEFIEPLSKCSRDAVMANTLEDFQAALQLHEIILSGVLQEPTVKELLFQDFPGCVKSLGAWGGDFVLVASKSNPTHYFEERGYKTIIPYREMIL